jgi:hypothetical protein
VDVHHHRDGDFRRGIDGIDELCAILILLLLLLLLPP